MDKKNEIDDLIVYASEDNPEVQYKNEENYGLDEEKQLKEDETEQVSAPAWIVFEDADELVDGDIYADVVDDADNTEDETDEEDIADIDEDIEDEEYPTKKKSKKGIIILFILILLAVLFAFLKNTEFIKGYSENFTSNMRKMFPALFVEKIKTDDENQETTVVVEDEGGNAVVYKEFKETTVTNDDETDTKYIYNAKQTYMIPYEGTADASIIKYKDGVLCGRVNSLSYINSNGEIEWEVKTAIASPVVKSEGEYIAVCESYGKRISLYDGSKLLFDVECPDNIKTCNVSSKGDVALVVEKDGYKGGVCVYNKYGKEVFVWSSGQNEVICADITSASRRVAVGLLNADESAYSIIQIFDITKAEPGAAVRFDDTIIFDIDYSADTVTGFGDNSLVCMTSTGRVIIDRRYDEVEISHKTSDAQGNKAILFDNNNIPIIQTYNRKGTIEAEVVIEELADCIDVEGEYFIYNCGRDVMLRRGSKKSVNVYTSTMDIVGFEIIDSKTFFIIHSNSLEIVKL